MKTRRLVALVVLMLGCVALARAADRTSLQAILISASNARGESDRRLAAYEPTLRRILRFESFRHLGEGSAALSVPASGKIGLGAGHSLVIDTEAVDGRGIHVRVRWLQDGRALMNTGLVLRPGVPAVLGGPSTGRNGEVYAVILVGS